MKVKYLLLLLIILQACKNQNDAENSSSEQSISFNSLTQKIEDGYYENFHSVIIFSKGEILLEKYFNGKDELLGKDIGEIQHSRNTLHDIRSITKSVISTCIGLAIEQKLISNTNQKISSFFPEFESLFIENKKDWTIHHFLSMTTGMEWNEDVPYTNPLNNETIMMFNEKPIEYVLSRPLIHSPGTVFNYSGGATQILLEIIERVSRMTIHEFVNKNLFEKININNFEWSKFEKSNKFAGPSGLRLTSSGLLNYAILYKNNGIWNGNKVISKDWIESSFTKHIEFPSDVFLYNEYYGYQFWIWNDTINNKTRNIVSANGNGDQNIYWDLNSELIVITTAGNYNNWEIERDSYYMLKNDIYSILESY